MKAHGKIAAWFWGGVAGWVAGGLAALLVMWEGYSYDTAALAAVLVLAGWSAMMVGVIGKGVELGMHAANDD